MPVRHQCHLSWRGNTSFLPALRDEKKQRHRPLVATESMSNVAEDEGSSEDPPGFTRDAADNLGNESGLDPDRDKSVADLYETDLALFTNGLDPFSDLDPHVSFDDIPLPSAMCNGRSCSCDSCINISQSISLDFSHGSEADLAQIENIEQLSKRKISFAKEKPLSSRSSRRGRRISETSDRYASLPRWTKLQSSRRPQNTHLLRSSLRTGTQKQVKSKRSDQKRNQFSRRLLPTTKTEHASTSAISKTPLIPRRPPDPRQSVALFDHMMTFEVELHDDPSKSKTPSEESHLLKRKQPSRVSFSQTAQLSPRTYQSPRTSGSLHPSPQTSRSHSTNPSPRSNSANPSPRSNSANPSPRSKSANPSPRSKSANPSPRTSRPLTPIKSSSSVNRPPPSSPVNPTRPVSVERSQRRSSSSPVHQRSVCFNVAQPTMQSPKSSLPKSPTDNHENLHQSLTLRHSHSSPTSGLSTPTQRDSSKSVTNVVSHPQKPSRSASSASLNGSSRGSKFANTLLRESVSYLKFAKARTKNAKNSAPPPVQLSVKQRSCKSLRRQSKSINAEVSQCEMSAIPSSASIRGRQPSKPFNSKGIVRPAINERLIPPIRSMSKTLAPFSKTLMTNKEIATGPTRKDVRHYTDSGMGSSASSTFSLSPRGPNVHHYISRKRYEKSRSSLALHTVSTLPAPGHESGPVKETERAHKGHESKKGHETEPIQEETSENHKKSQGNNEVNRKSSKHTPPANYISTPPPPLPNPESTCGCASTHKSRPSSKSSDSAHYQPPNPKSSKSSSFNNRSQLEKDFHHLLESLGFVSNPNEDAREFIIRRIRAEMRRKARQPKRVPESVRSSDIPIQPSSSQYSIPKANFLQETPKRRPPESHESVHFTPAVLLSDDPNDPRRRTDLKAVRHFLDRPPTPTKSKPRADPSKAESSKATRSQSSEGVRTTPPSSAVDKSREPSTDSKRASSVTSITRRRAKQSVISSLKPINLEQIRAIKNAVDTAIADQKIFAVYGAFPSIREALKSRGWIEKRPYPDKKPLTSESDIVALRNRGSRELFQNGAIQTLQSEDPSVVALLESMTTNPNEIDFEEELTERAIVGRMLRNVDPNFIWTVKCEAMDWKRLKKKQLINRYPRAFFATKIGLSTFLRQMHWFSEVGISMTRFPRCYNICQADDMEAFVDDFRLTACLSVLKLIVERFQKYGDDGVHDENGKVPKYAMEFAVGRCSEYLIQNTHADLDQPPLPSVHCHQWDQFLSWSYELRSERGRFNKTVPEPTPVVMCETAKDIIKRMAKVWPQLDLDGYLNIWILKPGAKSRGRGIHLFNRLDAISEHVTPQHIRDARYVAQKYIERPLLIFGTKFDIRQWFLVTSVYPMTIWMYRESYLRFCSQSFSLVNMHESVHLCNNAVQQKYKNGKRDPALPDENMWDCYTFQTYLRALGRSELWDSVIYPGMRQGIIGSLLASQEHMDRRGDCFELFGADFMLTEDFIPWLIEINSCPCMAPSTSVTARMCSQCLEDVIKVVIDRRADKNADTGKFELVYRQHIPPPPPYLGMSLSVRGRNVSNGSTVGNASPGHSPKEVTRRVRRPSNESRRRQRNPRIVLPTTENRPRLKDTKLSNDSASITPTIEVDEITSSGSETDSSSTVTLEVPGSAESETRPPRTPTPTCPPSRLENIRCVHRPTAIAALVAKQRARQKLQPNLLAAVGQGVLQPAEDNHKKSMELLREWRQRARTSGLLSRYSTNKFGSLSSTNSADVVSRMSSSSNSNSSGLMAVGVTLNSYLR